MLQLNPTFLPGGTVDDLVGQGALHAECARIFRLDKTPADFTGKPLQLHTHQRAAILKSKDGKSYVLTSGTGSGKSLAYIIPIVDHVLRRGSGRGIQAIVVYPMNALANSHEELKKFLVQGYPEDSPPLRAVNEKKVWWRKRARIQRSTSNTPASALGLSRARRIRAGTTAIP